MSLGGVAAAGVLLAGASGTFLEGLRELDLNDYAAGVAYSARTLPYGGADQSWSVFPYLTSVEDSTLTTNAFVIRNGAFGFRNVLDSGFEYGVLAHVETLGFGTNPAPELAIFDPPAWTLELGPTIGWRGLPIQPDLSIFKGVIGGHSGLTGRFSLSLPIDLANGYVVPYVSAIRQDDDFVAYYYDVPPAPTAAGPLDFTPEDATNIRVGFRAGYRVSEFWIVTLSAWVEELDDVITSSPLVDEERMYGATVGLAYNRSIFRDSNPDALALADDSDYVLSMMAVFANVDSDLTVPDAGVRIERQVDVEDALGLEDDATIYRVDGMVRFGRNHRIEMGYSELNRSASVTLSRDVLLGDTRFAAGERVNARYTTRYPRAAYGYSFLRDDQKELGVLVGVQVPSLSSTVSGSDGDVVERDAANSPVLSVGAFARVALRGDFSAQARIETANGDFDRYSGRVIDFLASADWEARPWLDLSLGYAIHHARLEALDRSFVGTTRQRYSGFYAGMRLTF